MIAVNDGIVLRNHIPRILKRHFRGKPCYVDLLDLFNEVWLNLHGRGQMSGHFYQILETNIDCVCAGRVPDSMWTDDRFDHYT